jgi:prolycopene isomerase
MSYDIVVVGGGIGGLTVAALLSARGLRICLLERQSQVGGCVARVEFAGCDFEPGMGLYPSWGPDEIHQRVFSELSVGPPETQLIESDFVVRLLDGTDIRLSKDDGSYFEQLRKAFPECGDGAVEFYRAVAEIAGNLRFREGTGGVRFSEKIGQAISAFWRKPSSISETTAARKRVALDYASHTSDRFRTFIDSQLRAFLHTPIERCSFPAAGVALTLPRRQLYSITGGPATVAERLAEAIKKSGGVVRLNSPVLRLAYDNTGRATGVDLLSGETVNAKRAIVSNMTIWDTYGKLVGLNRTPREMKKSLATIQGSGAYVIYASMDHSAASRLPGERLLVAGNHALRDSTDDDENSGEFTLAVTSASDRRAPNGKQAVTLKWAVDVNDWFSFQSTEEEYEGWDQAALERFWGRLHRTLPELGGDIEVVETATPRTFYDLTRRKLGMVLGVPQTPEAVVLSHSTTVPNLFIVGDTISGPGLTGVTQSALALANMMTR